MPVIRGRKHYWWNWSAKDLTSGVLRTFFTDGYAAIVTREQLLAHVKINLFNLDWTTFTAELTETLPQNRRDFIPNKYRMNDWQLWSSRQLSERRHDAATFAQAGLGEQKIIRPKRSILYGTASY